MSTDYDVICDRHKVYCHLGQRHGVQFTFGLRDGDDPQRDFAGLFIVAHGGCGARIAETDCVPEGYRAVKCPIRWYGADREERLREWDALLDP
jgi:hypothetical protein